MSIKRSICLVACLIIFTNLFAQPTQNAVPYNFLNNMVQPAPNAAALGKYVDYPVGYYTGVPDISVPLYNLKDGGINLPVSLSYHSSGIRVSELATWVGLGWVLNAGGMITRTVMGAPDEGTHKASPGGHGPAGYYRDSGVYKLPILPYPLADSTTSDPANNFQIYTAPGLAGAFYDCEPDIYTFNFNGHAGKFVFDEYRHPQLLEDDNLKISVNYSSGSFNSFTITTPDGIKYIFGENNTYEYMSPSSTYSGTDNDSWAPSSWPLTRVININTKDTLTLSYTPETYTYHDLGMETNVYLSQAPTQTVDVIHVHTNDLENACNLTGIQLNFLTTTVHGLRLTAIKSKNFNIRFVANNVRSDLVSGASSKAYSLDSVKVYNNLNACIRQFYLAHSNFLSTATTTANVTTYLNSVGDNSDRYRLKLLSVTEYSGDHLISKPPYVFSYYETTQLPRRMSYDQDHWGFCNNPNGDMNMYFTPTVTNPGPCTTVTTGANRTSYFPFMQAFTLTSMKDPLGAVTNFTFEGNTASNISPANSTVGGLRINQITVTDSVTGKVMTRKFAYNNSGQLFRMPSYITILRNEFYWAGPSGLSGLFGYIGYTQPYVIFGILRQSQSVVPLQEVDGGHIGYANVTETFGANGEGGYITRLFKVTASAADSLSSRILITPYTANSYMKVILPDGPHKYYGLYGNGHFNDFSTDPSVQPQNLQYYNGYSLANFYPLAPLQIDFERGKLLSELTYDSSGHKIVSTDNTYSHIFHESPLIRGIKCYGSVTTVSGGGIINWYGLTYYKYHSGISHLTSTTKKTFTGASYLTELTNYTYDSPYHTLKTSETTTSSQGDTYISRTYYSFDYTNSATGDNIFGKMKARNILQPINSSNWKNGNLVETRITQYQDFASSFLTDTLIYPGSIYMSESVNPLTPAQASQTTTWGGQLTTLVPNSTWYKQKVAFNYDSYNGKLINQQLTANINHAVGWDNQLSLPVAVVDNAYNQSHTIIVANTGSASITLPQTGGGTHYITPFTVTRTGSAILSLSFSGNPNPAGNPHATVTCQVTGTTTSGASYDSGVQLLCIFAGGGTCSYPSTTTLNPIQPGQYTLIAYYTNTPVLFCNVLASVNYPLASTYSSSGPQQFYYQGFEQSLVTNTSPGVTNVGTAHTGTNFYNGAYTVIYTPPADGRTYKISYWYLSGGVWLLQPEQTYSGSSFTLTGGTAYDDIRVYPSDAQMTSYTYDPTGNITSSIDAKGLTVYYEYDAMQRLINVKDKDGNIVKHIDYHYHGQ